MVISEKENNKNNSQILSESDKININNMMKKFSIKEIVSFINENRKNFKKINIQLLSKIKK